MNNLFCTDSADVHQRLLQEGFVLLPRQFYAREDVVQIAQELIGKYVFTAIDGELTGGRIVETEAYCGESDKACHAYRGLTKRTAVMFGEPGHAYVYLCYGIHQMFNIVTNQEGKADAVLIRAIEPQWGIETMKKRRSFPKKIYSLTSGPGSVAQALGIHFRQHHGEDLLQKTIWLMQKTNESPISATDLIATTRIGVSYAEESAALPWRFCLKGNPYVSRYPMKKV
ncbi:MAG: DNA-3-methyladenine glycosylase [Flammeovirgaceae bacterium]|nr:DNA-3-methyladenine glycosylase [Flammeovirgaceae bacterium]MDW8287257.1 DNA-3-methyladenine glycosylase [Flammeovirgaceae bacterium]